MRVNEEVEIKLPAILLPKSVVDARVADPVALIILAFVVANKLVVLLIEKP